MYGTTKVHIDTLLTQLRTLRTSNPEFRITIDLIERFITDFDRLAAVQRIIAVPQDRVVNVEVDRAVLVPTKDSEVIRNELAMSLLIEKLVLEMKRIKQDNPSVNFKLE